MRNFHYFDSTEVKVGDVVRGPGDRLGRVDEIIQPASNESQCYGCPNGGVRFIFEWDDISNSVIMQPPDGESWEDIEYIERAK